MRRKRRVVHSDSSDDEADKFMSALGSKSYIRAEEKADRSASQEAGAKWRPDEGRASDLEDAPVFFPGQDEFKDPLKYIERIRADAEAYGICRIVPPRSWRPYCRLREDSVGRNLEIPTRLQPVHMLQCGQGDGLAEGRKMSLPAYKLFADEFKRKHFDGSRPSTDQVEAEFWRIVESPTEKIEVVCGTPVQGTGFSTEKSSWNLSRIARHPRSVLSFEPVDIPGVTVPWLYVGMCLSCLSWHAEDHFLYSISYLHFGDQKVWYGVPRSSASKLEDVMKRQLSKAQPHKLATQIPLSALKDEGVAVYRTVQRAGDFIVTFPRAFHCSVNTGYNCAEAVNFAPLDWLFHGQVAVELYQKQCRKASISYDKVLIAAARQKQVLEEAHLKILLAAFKARVGSEESRRSWLGDVIQWRRMDAAFDSEQRGCIYCHYDLHLSCATCECSSNKYVCLEHLGRLCECPKENKYALYRYEMSELYEIVKVLEDKVSPEREKDSSSTSKASKKPKIEAVSESQAELQDPTCETTSMKSPVVGSNQETSTSLKACSEANSAELNVVILSDSDEEAATVGPPKTCILEPDLKVQLLEKGVLFGWCTQYAILPAGFKSRILYHNYLDLPGTAYYISEIVDVEIKTPYFKVSLEDRPAECFTSTSIHNCWRSVQERVNYEICCKRKAGVTNLPKTVPADSINGYDMFGLTNPHIKQVVEQMDPAHACFEYWAASVAAGSTSWAEKGITYERLRRLFRKGNKKELWEVHQVLAADWGSHCWKQGFQALADELECIIDGHHREGVEDV